jgi:hypothetical protein
MKKILSLFVCAIVLSFAARAQYTTLIYDTFVDNVNGWAQEDNSSAKLAIRDGQYYFENRGTGQYHTWKYKYLGSDPNFEVWAVTQHVSGVDNWGYGLHFGGSNADNCYEFMIAANGYFKVGTFSGGTWSDIIAWTTSSAIETYSGATNDVGVICKNGNWYFMINTTQVASLPARSLYGNNFGVLVENYQTVNFDDFEVLSGIFIEGEEMDSWEDDSYDDIEFPDPSTLPINYALRIPATFDERLKTIICDFPNNFSSVRGALKEKGEYDLTNSFQSLISLEGFESCEFNQAFLSNDINFLGSYTSYDKDDALRVFNQMRQKLMSINTGCTALVYEDMNDSDPESAIPYSTIWLPFNLSEPAATDYNDFTLTLEVMKLFDFDQDFNMIDEWHVNLRVGKSTW